MTADLVAGSALVPVAVLSLKEVRHRRELMFALLPALFAAHQFLEVAVWAGLDGDVSTGIANLAMRAYLFIAWPLLPLYMPVAVMLIDPALRSRRIASAFVALGAVVSAYLGSVVLVNPVEVIRHENGLEYANTVQHPLLWAVLYIIAVIGPELISRQPSIISFGIANLVGLSLVAVYYSQEFASLWCVFAAGASVLILLHMIRLRQLPVAERLRGEPVLT